MSNVDDPTLEGAGENQPPVSQEKGKSIAGEPSNSQGLLELKKELELTRKELKGLQSRQDKEKNEYQRFMDEIKTHTSKGKSLEEAESIVYAERDAKQKDDLLLKIAQKVGVLDNSPTNLTGNKSNSADEVASVFSEYGVDPNDPEAVSLYNLQGVDLIKAVSKLAVKKAKTSSVDSSEATSLQGSPSVKDRSVEELTKKYQQDLLATPRGKSGDSVRRQLKEQARKNGVPVDSIAFV